MEPCKDYPVSVSLEGSRDRLWDQLWRNVGSKRKTGQEEGREGKLPTLRFPWVSWKTYDSR